jgi:hypothetical protein
VNDETEYFVESFGGWLGTWYFISRLRGLTNAIELAAVFRRIKDAPSRVRRIEPEAPVRFGVAVCTVRE